MKESIAHPLYEDSNRHRRRVLLKLSGEVFGGGEVGISTEVVRNIARQIAATVGEVETSIVIGGGNFSVAPNFPKRGWTVPVPTIWACWVPS